MSSRMDRHLEKLEKNRELLKRVEEAKQKCDECNDWEDSFLESVEGVLMKGHDLSPAQLEKLEQIEYLIEWGRDAYWEEFGNRDR